MDIMELLSVIDESQNVRMITENKDLMYAGRCGDMPYSVLKAAGNMFILSVVAVENDLCILLGEPELFDPFGLAGSDDEDDEEDE